MPDKITQVNHDVRSDVNASVGSLGKLKAGEVGVKTDVVAKNLFEKYPNTDRIIVVQMMAATYCSLLRDSKTVRDSEKLRLWAEFSERVFKFENPNYNPTPQQAPKPKRRATPDHKGSPVLTNSGGSVNNGTERELHGGQQGPPSGSSDTFKTDATVATELRRAKPTIEFEFPTTGDRKQKFYVHDVRPNLIQIEPRPTGVNEDDLPKDVPVVSGAVTILKFGQEDEGGYIMLDTSQVPKGTRIRGEIIGYTEVTAPNAHVVKDVIVDGVKAEGANGFGVQHVIWNGGKVDHVTYEDVHDCTGKAKDVISNNGDVNDAKYHNVGSGDCGAAGIPVPASAKTPLPTTVPASEEGTKSPK